MNPHSAYPHYQPTHVVPIIHSLPPKYALQQPPGKWTTGLCDCCDDYSSCCLSLFCPCVVIGRISEIINGGTVSCGFSCILSCGMCYFFLHWAYGCINRSKLRQLLSLPELPFSDMCLHCCCSPCALSQEYRELTNRGAHIFLGWDANVKKWQEEGLMPPIVTTAMLR